MVVKASVTETVVAPTKRFAAGMVRETSDGDVAAVARAKAAESRHKAKSMRDITIKCWSYESAFDAVAKNGCAPPHSPIPRFPCR